MGGLCGKRSHKVTAGAWLEVTVGARLGVIGGD